MLRRIPPALALVCVAGAVLRFATLDVQSLWYDEAITAQLLRMSFSGLLHAIPGSESSPPLYYVIAWLWTRVFGTSEVGLRSLSALFGTATIPVAWALARRLRGDGAALIAAALVAVNPMLVWFSQEARAYELLALLAALSALLWLRALERPGVGGRALAWSLVAALALATHYYVIFLVGPQAIWLVIRTPDRRARAAAIVPMLVALVALAPLALKQRANDSAAFITSTSLLTRVAQLPKQFLVGYDSPAEVLLAVLSALLLLVAIGGVARLIASRTASDDLRALTALTTAALALPVIAALIGEDHLITRNVLAAAPLGAALAGAGLVATQRAWLGRVTAAAACAIGLVVVIGVDSDARSQRDDWRGAVRALGHAAGQRLILATPGSALAPLRYYLPSTQPLTASAVLTGEIDYVALSERSPGERPKPPRPARAPIPAAGFTVIGRTDAPTFTVLRLRAATPTAVGRAQVAIGLDGKPPALLLATR